MKSLLRLSIALLSFMISITATATDVSIEEIAKLRAVADSLHSIGRSDSAIIIGNRAIELAKKSGNRTQIVGTNAAQGVFLRSTGKVNEALRHYQDALEIVTTDEFRKNPSQEDIEETASLYINLAVLNLDMTNKDDAAKYAVQSGEWISKSDDAELKSQILGVVGSVLTGCGDLQNAMDYQDLSYKYALESGNKEAAFRSASYTLLIADRLGNKDEASQWRKKCLELLPEVESTMALLVYYQVECSINIKGGNQSEAIDYFNKILALDGIESLPFIQLDCYNNMHTSYAALGDYKNAYSTLLKGNEVRDSLYEQGKAESLRELTVKYETKETELALAQSEAKRATTGMWLLVSLIVLLAIIVAFMMYVSRQRHIRMKKEMEFARLRADIGLQLTQQYVKGLENERERMAKELHDGVCNDLLAIQMNIKNGASEESTGKLIESCRDSVRRISHELMPPEFAYATIDEVIRYYIDKQADANAGKVNLVYTSFSSGKKWESIPDNVALEIYRIVQEAVSNSLKHSTAKEIKVNMEMEDSNLNISISDNGTPKFTGKRGIGLDSMKRRAGSINAVIGIQHPETGGTIVSLTVNF